jgi:hypothetical protein
VHAFPVAAERLTKGRFEDRHAADVAPLANRARSGASCASRPLATGTLGRGSEAALQAALAEARQHSSRVFELRAACDLALLWGERQKARDWLAPVHGWFTEGFDTADLRDAKALLEVRPPVPIVTIVPLS